MPLSRIFHAAANHLPAQISSRMCDFAGYLKAHEEKLALIKTLENDLKRGTITQEDACWIIAQSVHGHTFRNDGSPTMSHIRAVYNAPDLYPDIEYTDEQKKLAIVHDVPEDSIWKVKNFKRLGFSKEFCAGLDAISRRPATLFRAKEKYFDNAERISKTIALEPKIGDNRHNWANTPKPDKAARYRITSHYYIACRFGRVEKGSSVVNFATQEGFYNQELFSQYSSKPVVENYMPPIGKEHMSGIPAPAAV